MAFRGRLKAIYDVFSRRRAAVTLERPVKIPDSTRTGVLLIFRDVVSGVWGPQMNPNANLYWVEVHNSLQHLHKKPTLSDKMLGRQLFSPETVTEDLEAFVYECTGTEFLDFVELSFKVDNPPELGSSATQVIDEINQLFRHEDLPYHLTDCVRVEKQEFGTPFPGGYPRNYTVTEIQSYPMILKSEEEVAYTDAIAPALKILEVPHFQGANEEFREGLEHYRKGRYKEAIASCGSALESVLKVICDRKGWRYRQEDALGDLLDNVVPQLGLEGAFKEKFKLIATIRNRFSSSHGGGQAPRKPERHFAQYVVVATAAIVVLLVTIAEGGQAPP